MHSPRKTNSQLDIYLAFQLCDTYAGNADKLLEHGRHEEALNSVVMAENQLESMHGFSTDLMMRKVVIARIKGSVAYKEGRLEEAKSRFKEVVTIAELLMTNGDQKRAIEPVVTKAQKLLENISQELSAADNVMLQTALTESTPTDAESDTVRRQSSAKNDLSSPVSSPPKKKMKITDHFGASNSKAKYVVPKKLNAGGKTDKKKLFDCPYEGCTKAYVHKEHLNVHIKAVHKKILVPCEKGCGKEFPSMGNMRAHVSSVHNREKFPCPNCKSVLASASSLRHHIAYVHEKVARVKTFKKNTEEHVTADHLGEQSFECPHCAKKFTKRLTLGLHVKRVHNKIEAYKCELCDRKFIYPHAHKNHTRNRICNLCADEYQCLTEFTQHKKQHDFLCGVCGRVEAKFWEAHEHAITTHIKDLKCPLCSATFPTKTKVHRHLRQIHDFARCTVCIESFESEEIMVNHRTQSHPQSMCTLCVGDRFKFFTYKELSKHIAKKHLDIFHCITCGLNFANASVMTSHTCKARFRKHDLEVINFLRQPIKMDALVNVDVANVFTDDNGLIVEQFPGFPFQGICSIDESQNTFESMQIDIYNPPYLNQNQELIQCGATAILSWNLELNALRWCYEVIQWKRTPEGAPIPKPRFDRSSLRFRRDARDLLFNIPSRTLDGDWQLGHMRAAGNCFTQTDHDASFSNLNYFPMHAKLNQVHWRYLEQHIREKSQLSSKTFITTGPLSMINGKISSNYVKGVYCPPAFYKIAIYEAFDGQLEIHCWIMRNDASHQPLNTAEVSMAYLERLTRTRYLTPTTLARVSSTSIDRMKSLAQHFNFDGH